MVSPGEQADVDALRFSWQKVKSHRDSCILFFVDRKTQRVSIIDTSDQIPRKENGTDEIHENARSRERLRLRQLL